VLFLATPFAFILYSNLIITIVMITKTYQALKFQTYDMYTMVDGRRVLVAFRGGSLRPQINGTFQTSDPKLQEALKKDTSNGITFREIGSFDDEATVVEQEFEETTVPGITTVQAARDYILSHIEGLSASSMPNKTIVMAVAQQNKYVFPDLK